MRPLDSLVPMLHVASVPASIAFYEKLGFAVVNTFKPADAEEISWAYLESGGARLMVTRAGEPVDAAKQAVIYYIYCDDVKATRAALEAARLAPRAIEYPFYAPRGEFRLNDLDGNVLMITHT